MKLKVASLAGGALLFASTMAAAEAVISTDQEVVIRSYVTEQSVSPIEIPAEVAIEVGSIIPDTIDLLTLDAPDVDVEYRYVVVEDRIVLVEPESREIIHIIQ